MSPKRPYLSQNHVRFPIRQCGLGAQLCHDRSLHYMNILRAAENLPPLTRKKCQGQYWSNHCECFSRTKMLHKQLQPWMPQGVKYCSECRVFTKRRKSKKFRCTHGRKKQYNHNAHITSNLWTNHKGRGGYYHKLWKKWFNNSAFDKMEDRLRHGRRESNPRYNLRKEYMPRARYLDTTWSRHERGSWV
ncbi:uncharacterized protein EAE97_010334 [Botrytis byssoidea]|uniref:Uncharacterized protein n=1 Tax=Botrytis byssoidea TaxID=139641 RepID=A0A9P5I3M3_9HELO|nr:uncharacterized protein EAE97_010334 [Botrytis byssoidea]KAF7926034.1 hypothetical protein EAE97_010334 [Botrytis byssoidea]